MATKVIKYAVTGGVSAYSFNYMIKMLNQKEPS